MCGMAASNSIKQHGGDKALRIARRSAPHDSLSIMASSAAGNMQQHKHQHGWQRSELISVHHR